MQLRAAEEEKSRINITHFRFLNYENSLSYSMLEQSIAFYSAVYSFLNKGRDFK